MAEQNIFIQSTIISELNEIKIINLYYSEIFYS